MKSDFSVIRSFSLYSIPTFLEMDVRTLCKCSCQLRLESIVSPKNLVVCFSRKGNPSIINLSRVGWELDHLKLIKFVLLILRDNLLDLNHCDTLVSSELSKLDKVSKSWWEQKIFVSSAKRT